jgi:hypothetical protein
MFVFVVFKMTPEGTIARQLIPASYIEVIAIVVFKATPQGTFVK